MEPSRDDFIIAIRSAFLKKGTKQSQDSENKEQSKENVVDADFEEVKEDKSDEDKEKRA